MAENKAKHLVKFEIITQNDLWKTLLYFKHLVILSHIMHCSLSNLLQSVQHSVHSPRYLNNIKAATSELHTTVLATNCVAQHTAIWNYSN